MRSITRFAMLPLLIIFAAPLRAQNAAPGPLGADTSQSSVVRIPLTISESTAPRVTKATAPDLRAGAHYNRSTQAAVPMTIAPGSQTQPVALMIVGGAALLAGAIIGGDAGTIFMVGGAVVGLVGLYQYLQ
jgi:hypothetical protein